MTQLTTPYSLIYLLHLTSRTLHYLLVLLPTLVVPSQSASVLTDFLLLESHVTQSLDLFSVYTHTEKKYANDCCLLF